MAAQGAREQAEQIRGKTREMGGQARDQAQSVFQKLKKHSPGPVGWVALIGISGALFVCSAIVLTLLSPVLLFFSPVLIPVGIVLFLVTAGIVTTGSTGVAALVAAVWLYRYVKGEHPRGSDKVNRWLGRVQETAGQVKHKAQDVAGQIPMPIGA